MRKYNTRIILVIPCHHHITYTVNAVCVCEPVQLRRPQSGSFYPQDLYLTRTKFFDALSIPYAKLLCQYVMPTMESAWPTHIAAGRQVSPSVAAGPVVAAGARRCTCVSNTIRQRRVSYVGIVFVKLQHRLGEGMQGKVHQCCLVTSRLYVYI